MANSKQLMKQMLGHFCKIPGAVETYLSIYDVLGKIPAYDASWRHLPSWLKMLNEATPEVRNVAKRRILVFSVYPYWVDYSLALSVLLAGRGVVVDFAWSTQFAHMPEVASPKGYLHWLRLANKNRAISNNPRLNFHPLEQVISSKVTDEMEMIAIKQAEMDVSYLLQKERIELDANPADKKAFEYRKRQNLDTITRIATLVKDCQYERVILPSGGILEFGAIFQYVKSIGLAVSSIENCDVNGKKVWVSNNSPVINIDTGHLWSQDGPHDLSAAGRSRVQKVIDARQNPGGNDMSIEYQRTGLEPEEHTRKQLGLHINKPVVLICPNVPFDAIFYATGNNFFAGMWEWLAKTCIYLADRSDCQVVIRSHPAEPHYKTRETTESLLREFLPVLPAHFTVVPPTAPISTYSIMRIADLGLVYASTTGLEMAMRGVPVVCGNSTQHYNQKGFTIDPANPDEYFDQIDRILQDTRSFRLTKRQVELAWCYADVYFNKWYRPFPWQVFTLWGDLKAWPMERMLSREGIEEFGEVLSILLGE